MLYLEQLPLLEQQRNGKNVLFNFLLTDRFEKSTAGGSACTNLSNYSGGTFKGLTNGLDYIKGMGFDAVWISPVVDNLSGGYHGYWAKNWEGINSNFGTEAELTAFV